MDHAGDIVAANPASDVVMLESPQTGHRTHPRPAERRVCLVPSRVTHTLERAFGSRRPPVADTGFGTEELACSMQAGWTTANQLPVDVVGNGMSRSDADSSDGPDDRLTERLLRQDEFAADLNAAGYTDVLVLRRENGRDVLTENRRELVGYLDRHGARSSPSATSHADSTAIRARSARTSVASPNSTSSSTRETATAKRNAQS